MRILETHEATTGHQLSREITYDDRRMVQITYPDGVKSRVEAQDEGNIFAWSRYTDRFDAAGNRLDRVMVYDDGTTKLTVFAADPEAAAYG